MSTTEEPQVQDQIVPAAETADSTDANGVEASVEDTTPKGETDSTPKESCESPAEVDVQTSQVTDPSVEVENSPPPKEEEPVADEAKTDEQPANGETDAPAEGTPADATEGGEGQEGAAAEGDTATASEDTETTTTVTTTTVETTKTEDDSGVDGETITVKETVVVKTTKVVENMTEEIDKILKEMTETGGSTTETVVVETTTVETKPEDEVDNKDEEIQLVVEETTETIPQAPLAETEPTECELEEKPEGEAVESDAKEDAETGGDAGSDEPVSAEDGGAADEQKEEDKKEEGDEPAKEDEEKEETEEPAKEDEETEKDVEPAKEDEAKEEDGEPVPAKEDEEKEEADEPAKEDEAKEEDGEPAKEDEEKEEADEPAKEDEAKEEADEKPGDEPLVITEVETETSTANETTSVTKKLSKRQLRSAGRRVVPEEQPAAVKPDEEDEDIEALTNKLKVKSIDLRSYSNQKAHHTDDYDVYNVVLRRGQQFEIKVGFEQPVKLDDNTSELDLVISLGESPRVTNDTRITIPVGSTVKKWRVDVIGMKEEEMTLRVHPPADAPVGKLNIGISAVLKPTDDPLQWKYVNLYEHDEHLYLLFNPWCRDDVVFLDNEDSRQEYVLNDGGLLFEGSHSNPKPRPWNFGQFDTFVVLASFHLLEKGLGVSARSSPIKVVRAMSAMVNSEDDDGVLIANWSGNYDNGKAPSEWAGSVEILSTYKVREQPIGYAQCGEFSGVLTSVLRCLGIPTRSVTAYSSAQDSDGSMTVDVHWNHEYQPYAQYNTDTVWVYHTFNECYMARPDLHKGKKLRGWQVVDGTPAERSDGIFQSGPAPVPAIKRGNVAVKYDSEYAFAMVNADRVHWMIQESGGSVFNKRLLHKEPSSIGRKIVTKAVGNDDIDNITSTYKYAEGSKEERRAVNNACSHGTVHKKYFETVKSKDFDMKLMFDRRVKLGDDVNLKMRLTNKTDVQQQVEIFVECYGTNYTGVLQDICRKEKLEATLPPGQKAKSKTGTKEKIVSGVVTAVGSLRRSTSSHPPADPIGVTDVAMTIYYDDYKSFILDHTALKFFIVAVRKEPRRHEIALQDEIMLQPPILKMTVADPSKLKRDEEFSVNISFTNPLPITLTECRFNLEGLRFQQSKIIQQGDIEAEADVKVSFNLTPKLAGRKVLVATLHTKELQGISGSLQLEIQL
ncbi:protein-glutamine gamma-glutamyltransferase K-like isoform X2 [Glandiceps talaboti]